MGSPDTNPALVVIDLLSHGSSHLALNRFWLRTLADHFRITLIAEATHIAALNAPGTIPHPVRRGWGWKFWREVRFLTTLRRAGKTPVFIMGATGAQLLTMAILERLVPRRAKLWTLVLHSEVEGVANPANLNQKLAGFAIRKLHFPRHAQAVVLGHHILTNLTRLNLASPRFHAIEHPLPDAQPITSPACDRQLTFAVTGVMRGDTKDLDMAGQLARTGQARVRFFGRRGRAYRSVPGVDEHLTQAHFSERWLKQRLGNSDFLLLCPARHSYRFTALGSLTDALAFGLPVAWLEHDALRAAESAPFSVTAPDVSELASRAKSYEHPEPEHVEGWVKARNQAAEQTLMSIVKPA